MVLSKRSLSNLEGVHPQMIKLIKTAILTSPYDFTVTSGVRTTAQQKAEYAKGRTTVGIEPTKARPLGRTVTQRNGVTSKSEHQVKADGYGYAVDLYPYYNGSVQVHDKDVIPRLKAIAAHIKKTAKELGINVKWGGDWVRPHDPPHFEIF